jgi:hypothetical protein
MMGARGDGEWRDYVANRLRESDARHDKLEAEQLAMRGDMAQLGQSLALNTATTNSVKADTAAIREATIGLRWIGKVARWFLPVAAAIGAIYGIFNHK